MLLLRTSEPLSLPEFVPEGRVAEQGPQGRELALDADPRRQDHDAVADPRRTVDRDHGALGTASARQGGLEGGNVVDADELADVHAGRGLAVHAEGDPAGAELGAGRERCYIREPFDRQLLAQVAGLQTERLVYGAVDDDDSALLAMRVRIAFDPAANAPEDLRDAARMLAVTLVKMETDDAGIHSDRDYRVRRTTPEPSFVSTTSKPAF